MDMYLNREPIEDIAKKTRASTKEGESKDDGFGLFIDYYIHQSKNYSYETNGLKKFELGLLDHVKRIRDGSVLLKGNTASSS